MSDWDDETLQRAYAASRRQRAERPVDARPRVHDIGAAIDNSLIDGVMPSVDRERILQQTLTCRAADALAPLDPVHHASEQTFAETMRTRSTVTRMLSRWPLAAAALVHRRRR